MKIDGVYLGDIEAKKFNDLLEYYNTKISPEDKYTESELASKLLRQGILDEWSRFRWDRGMIDLYIKNLNVRIRAIENTNFNSDYTKGRLETLKEVVHTLKIMSEGEKSEEK